MRNLKAPALTTVAMLAVTAFVGVSSASAAQWLDNGAAITTAENVTIVDDGNGLTFVHTGGIFGNHSATCSLSATGTVGPGSADTVSSVTISCPAGCTVAAVNLPWKTTLVSTTEDDISSGGNGDPGWRITCSGVSVTCTKAIISMAVTNLPTTPAKVKGTLTTTNTSTSCSDGGTGTVSGSVIISLDNGHNLAVG